MRTSEYRWTQVRVGLFVAIAGVVLFAAVFYFGIAGSPLSRGATVHGLFDNVAGMGVGTPVEMSGVVVGQVREFDLPELGTALVPMTLTIDDRALERLGRSSVAFAASHALVGQRYIAVTPRKPDELPLKNGSEIRTAPSQALDDVAGQTAEALRQVLALVEDTRQITQALANAAEALDQGKGTLGRLLKDDALYRILERAAQNAAALTNKAGTGSGPIATLLGDEALASNLRRSAASLAETTDRIRSGKGLLGRLTNDDQSEQRLDATLANMELVASRLAEAKGTLGALISDPALLARMNTLLGQMDSLVADVRRNPQRYLKIQAF